MRKVAFYLAATVEHGRVETRAEIKRGIFELKLCILSCVRAQARV